MIIPGRLAGRVPLLMLLPAMLLLASCEDEEKGKSVGEQCGDDDECESSVCWELVCRATRPSCGDGTKDAGEACDSGAGNSDTPCDPGSYPGTCSYCTKACESLTVTASNPCGNGTPDDGEDCDTGADNTDIPCDPGPYPGSCSYCNTLCETVTVDAVNLCGNGTPDGSEECDDGAENTDIPCDPGVYPGSCSYCNTLCETVTVDAINLCGNGTPDGSEECDDGADNTDTPCDPGAYPGSCSYCNTLCETVTVDAINLCGNGTPDGSEECDDGAENTDTPCDPDGTPGCSYCTTACLLEAVIAPARLKGVVTDATRFDLVPVAGAVVRIVGGPSVVTGADGSFAFEGLAPGQALQLEASAAPVEELGESYSRAQQRVDALAPGETATLRLRLMHGCWSQTFEEASVYWGGFRQDDLCPWFNTRGGLAFENLDGSTDQTELPAAFTGEGYEGSFRLQLSAIPMHDQGLLSVLPGETYGVDGDGVRSPLTVVAAGEWQARDAAAIDRPLALSPEFLSRMAVRLSLPLLTWDVWDESYVFVPYWFDESRGEWLAREDLAVETWGESTLLAFAVDRPGWWLVARQADPLPGCATGSVTRDGQPAANVDLLLHGPGWVSRGRSAADGTFQLQAGVTALPAEGEQEPDQLVEASGGTGEHGLLAARAVFLGEGRIEGEEAPPCVELGELTLVPDNAQCLTMRLSGPAQRLSLYEQGSWMDTYRGRTLLTEVDESVSRGCVSAPRPERSLVARVEAAVCPSETTYWFGGPLDDEDPDPETCDSESCAPVEIDFYCGS